MLRANTGARAIMVQGTASSAGKSILATGLCRIFKQDGFKVAPFKAQNMGLNSFITRDGLEMGRAQVAQAEAAGLEPTALMNPVLLKPMGDTRSQIIVCGEVWKTLAAKDYYAEKKTILPRVHRAYDTLAAEHDIIVLEGAGSPAEINLRSHDIVNMSMASYAGAPVLLLGDIERGGVFASLVGSMVLFTEEERDMVAGFIINKFRGDPAILDPGLDILTEKTGKPVFGVLPYLDIDIDDEDSLTEKFYRKSLGAGVDIAVIRLPHLSNFTDFAAFEALPNAEIRYVDKKDDLASPDMIFLGDSKNVVGDLLWMRQNGLEAKLLQESKRDSVVVLGIGGGYQMLGRSILTQSKDGREKKLAGMGLLPVDTVLVDGKTGSRVRGSFREIEGPLNSLSGMRLEGYESYTGDTRAYEACHALLELENSRGDRKLDGCQLANVYGSYVHGLFDGRGIASSLIRQVMEAKGLDYEGPADFNLADYKEEQYNKLADAMRKHLDMDAIYNAIGIER